MKKNAIVVAGGKGLRMGGHLPKQYLPLGGRPILMHTLEALHRFDPSMNLILVIAQKDQPYWQELCIKEHFEVTHRVTNGGNSRFESVKNGLLLVDSNSLVAIHDGVRPFVSAPLLQRCFEAAQTDGAILPTIPVIETLRESQQDGKSHTVDRNQYQLVQTPQVFRADILLEAYNRPFDNKFTDDASVVEAAGFTVRLVEGERENIKITTPLDLEIAECLLRRWRF